MAMGGLGTPCHPQGCFRGGPASSWKVAMMLEFGISRTLDFQQAVVLGFWDDPKTL